VSDHPSLAPIRAPQLREFAQYWLDCRRGASSVTRRADFDILQLRGLLPHVYLYDFNAEDRSFTLRVAGEEIRRMLPNSMPGTQLDQIIPSAFFETVQQRYRRVCEEPAAMHAIGRVFLNLGGTGVGERVILPLANERGAIHQMVGATLYQLGSHLDQGGAFQSEEVSLTFTPLA
jgi:hypothetical protein